MVARVDYANTYTGTTAYDIAYDDGELESDVVLENIRVIEKHANTTNPPGLGVEVVEKDEPDTVPTPILDQLVIKPLNESPPPQQEQQQQQQPSKQDNQPFLTTSLSQAVLAGENRLQVASQAGCAIGMVVQIGSLGGESSVHQHHGQHHGHHDGHKVEVRQIVGFGSLVLDSPLANSYSAGTTVLVYSADNAPPLTTPGVTGGQAPLPTADVVTLVKAQDPPVASSNPPQKEPTATAAAAGQPSTAIGAVVEVNNKDKIMKAAPEVDIPSTLPIVTTNGETVAAAAGSSAVPLNPLDAVGLTANTEPTTTAAPGHHHHHHHHHGHKPDGQLVINVDDDEEEGDDSSGRPDPSAYSPTDSEDSDAGSEGDDSVHIDGVFQKRRTPKSTLEPEGSLPDLSRIHHRSQNPESNRLTQPFPLTVSHPTSHRCSLSSCCDEDTDGVPSRAISRVSSGAFLSRHNSTKHGAIPDAEDDVLIEEGSKVEGTSYYITNRDSVLL